MSAIIHLSLTDTLLGPRACGECIRASVQVRFQYFRRPVVSPRWSVELDEQGKRRLVERWFKNE